MPKYRIIATKRYRADVKKVLKAKRDNLSKLEYVINLLSNGEQLPTALRNHKLQGKFRTYEECHIESDWLLVYQIEKKALMLLLVRTGTHRSIFEE
ncbi:MAG: type II toxin-antitoxin system YafQ family toxin [bacterium]|nr:type II toxin-antitoxin system YafQ family toxin [bacterium]